MWESPSQSTAKISSQTWCRNGSPMARITSSGCSPIGRKAHCTHALFYGASTGRKNFLCGQGPATTTLPSAERWVPGSVCMRLASRASLRPIQACQWANRRVAPHGNYFENGDLLPQWAQILHNPVWTVIPQVLLHWFGGSQATKFWHREIETLTRLIHSLESKSVTSRLYHRNLNLSPKVTQVVYSLMCLHFTPMYSRSTLFMCFHGVECYVTAESWQGNNIPTS